MHKIKVFDWTIYSREIQEADVTLLSGEIHAVWTIRRSIDPLWLHIKGKDVLSALSDYILILDKGAVIFPNPQAC